MADEPTVEARPRRARWTRLGLPVGMLVLGVVGAAFILQARPHSERRPPPSAIPLVRTIKVERTSVPLTVLAEGTVRARSESELVPEVSGRVAWVSNALRPGGFFEPDDVLLRIDSGDYEIALRRSRADLERTQGELELAEQNLARQEGLIARDASSQALLDDKRARARIAHADLGNARAALDRAVRDLERAELRAPFAGRVLEESVDVGQFITRGNSVAKLYAIDVAEIRLPIPDEEIAFLGLPLDYRGNTPGSEPGGDTGPVVEVRARYAGREHTWTGRVVRTEGQIDPNTRMVHVVVEVVDPYARGSERERPPLAVGLFVEAEIRGRVVDEVSVLPRRALRGSSRVWVIDSEARLRSRDVDVLREERERVIVSKGLEAGERVLVSALEAPVDGMLVEVFEPEAGAAP